MVASAKQIEQHHFLSQLLFLSSIPTYLFTRYITTAPFGRHVSASKTAPWWYGPQINAKISWFVFECPNLIWSCYLCWYKRDEGVLLLNTNDEVKPHGFWHLHNDELRISTNALLVCLFTLHYVNRAIVYPLRMNNNSQPVPFVVTMSAVMFTSLNGYLQCFYLGCIEKLPILTISTKMAPGIIQILLGTIIFFIGMCINIHSDGVLRNLRSSKKDSSLSTKQRRYYIPKGPIFTYISCPNFTGEIIEWFGFAVASHFSLASVAFFCYTASNLIPRGISHHEWYKSKFDEYPKERKWAVIPYIT
jgi:hypothetical protein